MPIIIGGLQKVTLVDYPGKVACTLFLTGCNFRCPFCYSKELVLPEEIKKHPKLDLDYIFSFLKERQGLIDGVVLCGGESTIYSELPELCQKIKAMGFSVKLDTNGSHPEMLKKLIDNKLIDYIAMDIKAPLEQEKYNQANGVNVSIKKIKESIDLIKKSGIDYEFRSTIVQGLHSEDDIIKMAQDIAPAEKYFLQQFRNEKGTLNPAFAKSQPFSNEVLEKIKINIAPLFNEFGIR
ncbi:MAG TPA: anaerobic ribonucleoside-triphosphate reductase activating protein [Candidatus Pacearchaeota archaeon]|nr:anaerobic ribonucleoside-triphosphate reductase activating protein [Candidatus Pacearchaeota archaeon]HRR94691.1 anaerobic ribonucleoside-triphosphate reductase activating protein [Candidatus Paceibacterota bacterium]HPC30371.1 anaerobic ribonucleoside-triphosphate reductase activating protein [Candidatus Pacearchaeota archaeon]HQG09184.1 anaerobic ribonucleoside-triphosphate reductase activating protein [Candidatus Pacearchaeota archaeon]HQH20240.1 anaerobic ribonucleoside-triphosphate redu